MTKGEIIKKRYPFYDENLSIKDVELNGEQVQNLMQEYADSEVKKLQQAHVSGIQSRIQQHNVAISLYRETVMININDTSKVKQYVDLIRDEEIAIRECQSILEYCL